MALLFSLGLVHSWRGVDKDPATGQPAIIEAQSVWRMRRIALAIETSRLAQTDSFLSFPGATSSVSLPLYDEVMALGLRAFSAGKVGAPHRQVDEGLLMRAVLRIGPILGLIFCLGLYRWLKVLGGGSPRSNCMATLWCCCVPIFLQHSQPGMLSIELFTALEALAASALLIAVFRSGAALDRFTLGMVAGGLCGIGLVTSPLFLIMAFAAWCAYLWESLRNRGEERTEWVRAFLLFWITAALGSQLPSLGGPWLPSQSGNPYAWTQLVSHVIIAGALPFLVFLWLPNKQWAAPGRVILPACVLFVGLGAAVSAWVLGADHASLALIFGSLQWAAGQSFDASLTPGLLAVLLFGALGAALLLRSWQKEWSAQGILLTVWGALTFPLVLLHEPAALFCLPVAGGIALRVLNARANRWVGIGALSIGLALGVWDSVSKHSTPDLEGLEIMQAARELRQSTASPGAFNSVHPVHAWGVLADERSAPLVAWYARRPCASLGPARNGDRQGRQALELALTSNSANELRTVLVSLGLRWSLLGSSSPGRLSRGGTSFPVLLEFLDWDDEGHGVRLREIALP